ncbi:Hypothetical protein NTJ_03744 [Nesidiocoris tenuis]|uniref:RGS domain-containing protein n=1 Tax=Nesidiocoris tenuis TaxID=355587 RepID=A0ABN7AF67_9HEMI|nr:Hypothetical protein NTJ_03744 [Nesidiocoris tenuis]
MDSCVSSNSCGACSTGERKSDVDRWTTHVSKVLNSPPARRKFRTYLLNMNLEEAENTLYFWEQIDKIQREKRSEDLTRNVLLSRYRKLYNHADEYVNLDEAELRQLKRLLKCSSPDEEDEILDQAKQSVQKLLMDDHKHFSSYLWKQLGR